MTRYIVSVYQVVNDRKGPANFLNSLFTEKDAEEYVGLMMEKYMFSATDNNEPNYKADPILMRLTALDGKSYYQWEIDEINI